MAKYNEQELTEKVKELAQEMFGWEMNKPVIIDGRPTRAWASAHFRKNNVTGKIELKCFKFAKRFVSGDYMEEDIISTIKHELIHWYSNISENKSCGHNYIWKNNCIRYGIKAEACSDHKKIGDNSKQDSNKQVKEIKQERPNRRDYVTEITLSSANGLVKFAENKGVEIERYEGSLLDNYILYNHDTISIRGVKPRKYILLQEKYKNDWSSVTELIMTDDIYKVESFLEMVS